MFQLLLLLLLLLLDAGHEKVTGVFKKGVIGILSVRSRSGRGVALFTSWLFPIHIDGT